MRLRHARETGNLFAEAVLGLKLKLPSHLRDQMLRALKRLKDRNVSSILVVQLNLLEPIINIVGQAVTFTQQKFLQEPIEQLSVF